MKHTLVFFLIVISTSNSTGQIVDGKVKSFIEDQKIDSFLVYTYPCVGYALSAIDSCKPMDTHYLIWTKNKEYFLKKFQLCKISKTLPISFKNPLVYYLSNRKLISKEKIQQPSCYEFKQSKKGIDTLLMTEFIDHSCFHTFTLSINKKILEKSADTFDLQFLKFDNGKKNIYYNYNQSTRFKHLIDITLELISQFDDQNAFEPE